MRKTKQARTKHALLKTLVRATRTMIQGGLSETSRRCGKPNCACATDPAFRHGPHLYLTYREEGASRSLYVPPDEAPRARAAHAAWAMFWEAACAIAALNRETWREQWQRLAPGAKRRRRQAGD
jgi:hypothetical protein